MSKETLKRVTDFNFEKHGSHVALVGKHQGGPGNGVHTIITKATESIEKAQIQVKLDLVSFLVAFFGMWHEQAATLAEILGFDTEYFNENYPFEDFNSLGATEVKLLKAASQVEKTEDSLVKYVDSLEGKDLNILKAFAEGFNKKLKEHKDMSDIQKALDAQKLELETANKAKLEDLQKALEVANKEVELVKQAKQEALEKSFIEKAKSYGADEGLGLAMAEVSTTEAGALILKALEASNQKLNEILEKEAGVSGEGKGTESESKLLKSLKNKYKQA